MPPALSISLQDLHAGEMRWVRRIMRNVEIRQRYGELQPEQGQEQAILQLAEEYSLSDRHIRTILYGRR